MNRLFHFLIALIVIYAFGLISELINSSKIDLGAALKNLIEKIIP